MDRSCLQEEIWENYFCQLATFVSTKSKDPNTKHGCVIVGPDHEIRSTGFNGMPRGIEERPEVGSHIKKRYERPDKYYYFEHSERNAIYNAARMGTSLKDCILYVTGWPCIDCTRAIIQTGIKKVVIDDRTDKEHRERWGESIKISQDLMKESGIICYLKFSGTNFLEEALEKQSK